MPTLKAERERVRWLIREGKVNDDEPCKVIFPRLDAMARAKNEPDEQGKQKTRFVLETDDHEMYSRFNVQKNRWIELIPNKSICVEWMCKVWEALTDEQIKAFGE